MGRGVMNFDDDSEDTSDDQIADGHREAQVDEEQDRLRDSSQGRIGGNQFSEVLEAQTSAEWGRTQGEEEKSEGERGLLDEASTTADVHAEARAAVL